MKTYFSLEKKVLKWKKFFSLSLFTHITLIDWILWWSFRSFFIYFHFFGQWAICFDVKTTTNTTNGIQIWISKKKKDKQSNETPKKKKTINDYYTFFSSFFSFSTIHLSIHPFIFFMSKARVCLDLILGSKWEKKKRLFSFFILSLVLSRFI